MQKNVKRSEFGFKLTVYFWLKPKNHTIDILKTTIANLLNLFFNKYRIDLAHLCE